MYDNQGWFTIHFTTCFADKPSIHSAGGIRGEFGPSC